MQPTNWDTLPPPTRARRITYGAVYTLRGQVGLGVRVERHIFELEHRSLLPAGLQRYFSTSCTTGDRS
jgi:hypothetical protein